MTEFVGLRAKLYAFKILGDDSDKKKRSKKHEVCTIQQRKQALNWMDDKRIVSHQTTDTLPWGFRESHNNVDDYEVEML
ncbi:hypothetical protein PV325_007837 [Microctonus aethiopoides]|nr:hypothetical protein PV325_007837 [Microctonus aethiopoides]